MSAAETSTSTPSPSTVVDLGDKGLSDGDLIDPYLDDYWKEGYEVHVPAGEYDLDNGSLLGISAGQDAWLYGDGDVYLNGDPDDFTVTTDGATHVRLQNLYVTGQAAEDGCNVAAFDSDGLIEFMNFNMPNGGLGSAAYHKNEHAGIARWINCHVEAFDSDGIYASSFAEGDSNDGMGTIEIYGGLYANCGVNCIRIGGDNAKVISTAVVCNTVPDIDGGTYGAVRGIRVREAGENQVIDDCDITVDEADNFGPPIVVADERFEGPGPTDITVTNTRIRNESSDNTVDTNSDDAPISGDTIDITGGGDYELEGEGPYSNIYYDDDADSPTTQKRWYDWDGSGSETSLSVTTDDAANVSDTGATLEGSLTDLGGASSADVAFQYRETGASSWSETATQTLSSTGTFSESVSGLEDGVEYEFQSVADASDGDTDSGSTDTFTTSTDALAVTTDAATNVSDTGATLEGSLTDLGGASSADVAFQYRETGASSWSETATQTLSSTGTFSESVSGLEDGVEYEFQSVADASDGDSATGSTVTFTTNDDGPVVTTGGTTDVSETSATVHASLDDLGNASSVDVKFQYRETGASNWSETATQTLSSTGTFEESLTDLDSGVEYEYRAVADASDGDSATGSIDTFTTDVTTTQSSPSVDSYTVTEAGSPNPHAEITADWAVSDADGDLSSVLVEVVDSDRVVVADSKSSVTGSTASDVDKFKIKHARGQTFEVRITVADEAGNQTTTSKTVSE